MANEAVERSYFDDRNDVHARARAVVQPVMETAGFTVDDHGAEFADRLSELVQTQDDRCSLMLRYRPDTVCVCPRVRSVLCEIKGTDFDAARFYAPRFFIEARALKALWEWNVGGRVAMLARAAFWPDGSYVIKALWADDIPMPREIVVPERPWDFDDQWAAMGELFPDARRVKARYIPSKKRSGTPYAVIPDPLLRPLDSFIQTELLGAYAPVQPKLF